MARRRVPLLIATSALAASGIAGGQLLTGDGAEGMPSVQELCDRGEPGARILR